MLYRYVNHDNMLAGHLRRRGWHGHRPKPDVAGNGATASIITRTDLTRATTDTTINFVLAEDPSTPYLIVTALGPIASLAVPRRAWNAKDPPGIFDKLPSLPRVTVPSISIPHIPLPHIPNPFGR